MKGRIDVRVSEGVLTSILKTWRERRGKRMLTAWEVHDMLHTINGAPTRSIQNEWLEEYRDNLVGYDMLLIATHTPENAEYPISYALQDAETASPQGFLSE